MTKSYRKNILRDLKGNMSRFISLFGIVLLGAMMLTGLMSFAPSMRKAGDSYFGLQNVFDIRVLSTLGLSESDISAIAAVNGVEAVMPVKSLDAEAHLGTDAQTVVVRIQQLPADPEALTAENMNRVRLLSGRLPEAEGECVVHVMGHGDAVEEGTTITLVSDDGTLNTAAYTVVGTVQDPLHFSSDAESSTAGDGQLDYIVFVPDGSFTTDYYTTCYVMAANPNNFSAYSDEYQAIIDEVTANIESISDARCAARQAQLIDDASAKLASAREEYDTQKANAEQQLADAEAQLDAALAQLNEGEAEYSSGKAQLEKQRAALPSTMQSGADEVLSGEEQVLEFEEQVQQMELLVNVKSVADPLLTYAQTALDNAQKALDEAEPDDEEYTDLRDALAKAQSAYDSIYNQLAGYQSQLDEGKRQMYEQGLISSPTLTNSELITEAKAALRKMKLQLLNGQLTLSTGTATAYTSFAEAEQQLADARTQLDEGWSEYNSGKQQLETSRAEAEKQLADGLAQLNDAEEQVSEIKNGQWYVLDHSSTVSFVTFEEYADRMAAIARVFPVFFFLVAALVASTTMTRMVDENRLQLGTLKALGYSSARIAGKYLFYGVAASLLGSVAGMALGFVVFPAIIWNAYTMIFTLPTFRLHFYPGLAAACVLINVAVIGLTTLQACHASLREKSAALLLPRAPAAGKRILLERITPLWERMSFSQKTTARNLFRYKKRLFMTVLGVAGCTALLLVGFGIQDSILPILDKQNTELVHSDLTVSLSDARALTTENGLSDVLDSGGYVGSWGAFYTKSITIYNAEGESASVTAVGAEDESKLTEFVTMRTRRGHNEIPFDENSVVLTEKTADTLGLKAGDTFWAENADGERVQLTLTGVMENYVFTRLYLSRQNLAALLGTSDFEWNTVYAKTTCETQEQRDALSRSLLECNYVSSAAFSSDTMLMFGNLIGRMNYVIYLIIICAAALAAVVLYNLISVNLAERKKELATIKVLGFYNKEVYRYIFREIELLSLIGSGVGLLLGVPLHKFIVLTVEMDQMMFIRDIAAPSYLYSVALTMVFTFAVCFVMRRHVRRISMVESMKAPE